MEASYQLLGAQLGINKNELKIALTHSSFYQAKDEKKGNSRFIFSGMFVFKGILANVLYNYQPNTGTKLQHILGNLMKNEYLKQLFDRWNLLKKVRAGKNFDIRKHKHLFVYAILGCISQADQQIQQRFIFRFFINDETVHIFNHEPKNKNLLHQLNLKSRPVLGELVTLVTKKNNDGLFESTVTTAKGSVLSTAESKSYRYSRSKAIKESLCLIAEIDYSRFTAETDYLEQLKKREIEKKQKKTDEALLKFKEKEVLREQRKEKLSQIKKARDNERKKIQATAKKRKAERVALNAMKELKAQKQMSANKRRFLEDKKK